MGKNPMRADVAMQAHIYPYTNIRARRERVTNRA